MHYSVPNLDQENFCESDLWLPIWESKRNYFLRHIANNITEKSYFHWVVPEDLKDIHSK